MPNTEFVFKYNIDNEPSIDDKISMTDDRDDMLAALFDEVHDEATFLAFIKALSEDWEDDRSKANIKPSSPYGSSING